MKKPPIVKVPVEELIAELERHRRLVTPVVCRHPPERIMGTGHNKICLDCNKVVG